MYTNVMYINVYRNTLRVNAQDWRFKTGVVLRFLCLDLALVFMQRNHF